MDGEDVTDVNLERSPLMTRKPSHPGALLRTVILPGTGLSVSSLATRCGVARNTMSKVDERAGGKDIEDIGHPLKPCAGQHSPILVSHAGKVDFVGARAEKCSCLQQHGARSNDLTSYRQLQLTKRSNPLAFSIIRPLIFDTSSMYHDSIIDTNFRLTSHLEIAPESVRQDLNAGGRDASTETRS